ncbi:Putative uncharacterized protein [Moritella viscosa]|uniref:Uncharacterized protein n=1 Tax=Moritella viscosa TaxID=80854 RepID=A0A1L0BYQ9_9GAMM|nr:Putative uncharacterized protein [Moritella viscosa]SHO08774.1 Putative uncharacterized protein [Moritella viscosa]SHO08826.1 Putative uncharacterized protein [Moritella viscosa]SHO13400.1 Putative uncharacterized protein [Moritella viscosa]SHO19220.1 Putative uncharacterized protein [Moritella viscosa]
MNAAEKQHTEVLGDISQAMAMNPSLSMDDLNLVIQRKKAECNNRPNADFCGLTPTQMTNWLYTPFSDLKDVNITTPDDLATSPVMRYLSLMLEDAMQQAGSIKATEKGNLPTKRLSKPARYYQSLQWLSIRLYQALVSLRAVMKINLMRCTMAAYWQNSLGFYILKTGIFMSKKSRKNNINSTALARSFCRC